MDEEKNQGQLFEHRELVEGAMIPEHIVAELETQEKRGQYTGARLKKRQPEIYSAITAMLSFNLPHGTIAKAVGVSQHTVAGIAESEPLIVAQAKKRFAEAGWINSTLLQEKLREMILKFDVDKQKAIKPEMIVSIAKTLAIVSDKASLHSGGVTERVAHVVESQFQGSWEDYLKNLPAPGNEVIDVTPKQKDES